MEKQTLLDIVNYKVEKAYSTLKEAGEHIEKMYLSTAMNRIYYSGFYIVSALTLLDNFSTSKHRQLIGYFNKEYVKANLIDKETAEILSESYKNRIAADYHDYVFLTKEEVKNYHVRMEKLLIKVNDLLKNKIEAIR